MADLKTEARKLAQELRGLGDDERLEEQDQPLYIALLLESLCNEIEAKSKGALVSEYFASKAIDLNVAPTGDCGSEQKQLDDLFREIVVTMVPVYGEEDGDYSADDLTNAAASVATYAMRNRPLVPSQKEVKL